MDLYRTCLSYTNAKMLQFVEFSSISDDTYLIMDEYVFYRWNVDGLKSKSVRQWLKNRDEYNFKLKYRDDYKTASIVVNHGDECLHCEEVSEVEWL